MKGLLVAVASIMCLTAFAGCRGAMVPKHDKDRPNIIYMKIRAYPDRCNVEVRVEFKSGKKPFVDTKLTELYKPLVYTVDEEKITLVRIKISRYGWTTVVKEFTEGVPQDVFIRLEMLD